MTIAPTMASNCIETASDQFYLKIHSKNDKKLFRKCKWLENRKDKWKSRICKVRVFHLSTGDVTKPAQDVCQKTCNSCDSCYENDRSFFYAGISHDPNRDA